MALLPYALRPSVIIRRKAIWGGLLGASKFWKVVAVWVFGKGTLKKFFGKSPESLGKFKVGSNSFVNVINAKPMSKKERKRQGITKKVLVDQAVADVAAARPKKGIRVK
ncbi:hypothetical protein [Ilumatobacter coccineus]|jgi:hypothetical protein|uniref:Uncharacterized protein n=1 Tax=Ilumatobacter coccineus (strain NBRC 103263 / KCTC 29153 / YM16-304) TaxID=1313172 RepID=A0A6C7ECM4_ILUCY|nr:hypothetical protein [Ilumatobacter coccineus]BAN02929.1 hypothetical protein YM304_26150 [Ilumatobacter coccineus YM16-304]